jgi:cardiolipin synthase A/B
VARARRQGAMKTRATLRGSPWWVLVFFIVGVLATAAVVFGLFFSLGRRPARMTASVLPPVDSAEFLTALSRAVDAPVHAGGTIELLRNGDAFFPAILDAVHSAKRSVLFLAYIWEPGRTSEELLQALIARAQAGVAVRLLLDGVGGALAPRDRLAELERAGGKVAWYRPPTFGKLTRFHRRNHRRAIVIDARVGFTGGAAVADKWRGNARVPDEWRDNMVRVAGPLAHSLEATFAQTWSNTTGEVLVGPAFFPAATASGSSPPPESVLHHLSVASSPAPEAHPLRTLYWLSFSAARRTLYLATPYFVPDPELRRAVMDRARAGVDVRILLPNALTDAKPIWWAGQSYYEELLGAGVRLFEYQPTFMHAKSLSVDGVWSVVGSPNMDVRSKELNEENVLAIQDRRFGAELDRSFLADLESSWEVRLEPWRRRGLWARARERLFVIFAEQF